MHRQYTVIIYIPQTQVRDENDQQYHSIIVNKYRYTSITRFRKDMFVIVQCDLGPVHHSSNPLQECIRERAHKDEHQLPNQQSINSRVDVMLANVHAAKSALNQHMEVKRPSKMMYINSPPSIPRATPSRQHLEQVN